MARWNGMSGRYSRAWVEVDLAAVVENARTAARVAGTRLLPVVKANAYGVGAVAVSRALETLDPWGYGVATVERSEEHTSELQSRLHLVCRLLLEKKKKKTRSQAS